jgi:hypothetical protein
MWGAMHTDDAFDIFQGKVNADAYHVFKARHRRNIFAEALITLQDVAETVPSGSLARGTQLDPIHDVDLIAVFDKTAHPGWGEEGDSAGQALRYTQERVRALLGDWGSLTRHVVGQTLLRNHVVKCFLEPRFLAEDKGFRGWFAVEVMPALRDQQDGVLLIPERKYDRWQKADPEWLIAAVRHRQERWDYFVQMVRVIKFWSVHVDAGIKSLAIEVLALQRLPDLPADELSRPAALLRFFTAAATAVMLPIRDPAGYCGEIQPDLDRAKVSGLLREAADIAADAVAWEQQDEHHKAICCWRTIFGPEFPVPPGGCPGLAGGNGRRGQAVPGPAPADENRKPPGPGGEPGDDKGAPSVRPPDSGPGGDDGGDQRAGPGWIGPAVGGPGAGEGSSGGGYERPRRDGPSTARPITDAPQGQA